MRKLIILGALTAVLSLAAASQGVGASGLEGYNQGFADLAGLTSAPNLQEVSEVAFPEARAPWSPFLIAALLSALIVLTVKDNPLILTVRNPFRARQTDKTETAADDYRQYEESGWPLSKAA